MSKRLWLQQNLDEPLQPLKGTHGDLPACDSSPNVLPVLRFLAARNKTMSKYFSKKYRTLFRSYARKGGKHARKSLSDAEYKAFRAKNRFYLEHRTPRDFHSSRRQFDASRNRIYTLSELRTKRPYYKPSHEEAALRKVFKVLKRGGRNTIPTSKHPYACTKVIRTLLRKELKNKPVRRRDVFKHGRKFLDRPTSSKFFQCSVPTVFSTVN